MAEFKNVFANLRKMRGYTQIEIAKLLNVRSSAVSMWESGARIPTRAKMEEIADFFNVDMDYIYGKTDVQRKVAFDENGNAYANLPDYDDDTMEIIELLGKINAEQKKSILSLLRSFSQNAL